ncbi:hypothetical protein KC622_03140 [Candidatus Dojkabacteria bacterium]|uniref:Uncharacterized protein n=1 Tax=Candidatus Dojkabacteria bacterium TaxID=2099670 RepID=A0A955HZH2_9BACT|nr:hypothetical protein [Candidatus Dojkabacteria bacterium]
MTDPTPTEAYTNYTPNELASLLEMQYRQSPDGHITIDRELLTTVIEVLRATSDQGIIGNPPQSTVVPSPQNETTQQREAKSPDEAAKHIYDICLGASIQVFQEQAYVAQRVATGIPFSIQRTPSREAENFDNRLFVQMLKAYDAFTKLKGEPQYWYAKFFDKKVNPELQHGLTVLLTKLGSHIIVNCFGNCASDSMDRLNDIAIQIVLSTRDQADALVRYLSDQPRLFLQEFFTKYLIPDFINTSIPYHHEDPFRVIESDPVPRIARVVGVHDATEILGSRELDKLANNFTVLQNR